MGFLYYNGSPLGTSQQGGLLSGLGFPQESGYKSNQLAALQAQTVASLLNSSFDTYPGTHATSNAWYHKDRLEDCVERGEKLIDRIAFWSALGRPFRFIVNRLADKLNAITDDAERWLAAGIA